MCANTLFVWYTYVLNNLNKILQLCGPYKGSYHTIAEA